MERELMLFVLNNIRPTKAGDTFSFMDGPPIEKGLEFKMPESDQFPNITEVQLTLQRGIFKSTMMEVYIEMREEPKALKWMPRVFVFKVKCTPKEKDLFNKAYQDFFDDKIKAQEKLKENNLEKLNLAIKNSIASFKG